ncbi:MAG: TIGR02186 family protein [Pseudomonadota bacterium]
MKPKAITLLVILWATMIVLAAGAGADQAPAALLGTLTVSPRILDIDAFFSGGRLTLTGDIGADEDIIIELYGKNTRTTFDLKDRIGPFWMTNGSVHFENIPEMYLLLLPDGQDWDKKAETLGLGMKQLEERVITSGTDDVPQNIFTMFTQMKDTEGLYKKFPQAVRYLGEQDGRKKFEAFCPLPALIATGTYNVKATVTSQGRLVRQITQQFSVREIGFVKMVNDMASNQRVVYGVAAVVIALMAGLIMGVLFRQSGGGH